MTKGWTEERRKQQADRCRQNKPWEKSTGPKTTAGKLRASRNACKHGFYSAHGKIIQEALLKHRQFMNGCEAFLIASAVKDYLEEKSRKIN